MSDVCDEAVPPSDLALKNPQKDLKDSDTWKLILSDSDMSFFNLFREWRSKKSKKEGVPPYVIFTNNQLAQIVKKRPQSISELSQIEGVGKSKLEKYGEEILEISKINIEESEVNSHE